MDEVLEAMRRLASTIGVSGVFSGPRLTGTGSGPISGPISTTGSGPSTMALDISVEEEAAKPNRKPLFIGLFAGSLVLGLGVAAFLATRPTTPQPLPLSATEPATPAREAPATPRPTTAAAAAPAAQGSEDEELALAELNPGSKPVRFLIASEPSGARVTYRGKDVGETPLNLEVTPGEGGNASAELTFTLAGYQTVKATAEGRGPDERFLLKLQPKKKASTKPGKGSGSSPYKDDPYQ
jgi:eukaryotic-like serine/threonine-protein kinase